LRPDAKPKVPTSSTRQDHSKASLLNDIPRIEEATHERRELSSDEGTVVKNAPCCLTIAQTR